MADWNKLSLIFCILGFEMDLLATMDTVYGSNTEDTEAMFIISFLSYLAAVVLIVLMTYGDLSGNKIVAVATTVCLFVAGLFILIGVALIGDQLNGHPPPYWTAVMVMSMLFALAAGVFLIMGMLGIAAGGGRGGGAGTSSSKTAPQPTSKA